MSQQLMVYLLLISYSSLEDTRVDLQSVPSQTVTPESRYILTAKSMEGTNWFFYSPFVRIAPRPQLKYNKLHTHYHIHN